MFSVRGWALSLVTNTGGFCLNVNIRKLKNAHVMSCINNVIWELNTVTHLFINVTETGQQKHLIFFMQQCIAAPFLLLLCVV